MLRRLHAQMAAVRAPFPRISLGVRHALLASRWFCVDFHAIFAVFQQFHAPFRCVFLVAVSRLIVVAVSVDFVLFFSFMTICLELEAKMPKQTPSWGLAGNQLPLGTFFLAIFCHFGLFLSHFCHFWTLFLRPFFSCLLGHFSSERPMVLFEGEGMGVNVGDQLLIAPLCLAEFFSLLFVAIFCLLDFYVFSCRSCFLALVGHLVLLLLGQCPFWVKDSSSSLFERDLPESIPFLYDN